MNRLNVCLVEILLVVCLLGFNFDEVHCDEDITMENIKFLNYTASEGQYKLIQWRIRKFNSTAAVMDADLELYADLDDTSSVFKSISV